MTKVRQSQRPPAPPPQIEPPQRGSCTLTAAKVVNFCVNLLLVISLAGLGTRLFPFHDTKPLSSEGFTSFPETLDRYVHPGWMMNDLGNRACDLSFAIPKPEECDEMSKLFEEKFAQEGVYRDFLDSPAAPCESGAPISIESPRGTVTVAVGVEPKQLDNHKQALRFIEKTFLQDPQFFSRPDEEILDAFKEANRLLSQGLDSESASPAGKWRDHMVYIFPRVKVKPGEDVEEARRIKMMGMGTWAQREVLIQFYHLADEVHGSYDGAYFALSPDEQETLKGILDVPPKPEEIEGEMRLFVKAFKEKGQQMEKEELDPLDFAAWVHHEIVRIHPHGEANGRLGRDWKYAVERRGGYEPIIIDDKETYTQKFKEGSAAFADYLRELVGKRRAAEIKV